MSAGRPSLGIRDGVWERVRLARHMSAALDTLAAATGEAKRSHLRRAVARYLADYGLLDRQNTGLTPAPKEKKK